MTTIHCIIAVVNSVHLPPNEETRDGDGGDDGGGEGCVRMKPGD